MNKVYTCMLCTCIYNVYILTCTFMYMYYTYIHVCVSGLQNVNLCRHQLVYIHKHALAATMPEKVAELERQTTASNPNGTFGFSVLGGAGTKFPAVVCEVDRGGPADRSGKVSWLWVLVVYNICRFYSLPSTEIICVKARSFWELLITLACTTNRVLLPLEKQHKWCKWIIICVLHWHTATTM